MPTTINDELTRIEGAKAGIKAAIENKGVTVSSSDKLDDYAALIASISTGGGSDSTIKALIDRSITSINFPSGITKIGSYALANCTNITSITIPNTVTTLEAYAFYNCGITSISIPDSVTLIGTYAFSNCKLLPSITIPSGVGALSIAVFRGCTALATLVLLNTTPPTIATNVFQGTPILSGTGYIYVPYSADHSIVNAYKTATNWSTYANQILELDENGNIPT